MDVLLGWLLPEAPNEGGPVGFVLFALQVIVLVVQLFIVGRARRYLLESERFAMRSEDAARRTEDAARRAEDATRHIDPR